MDESIRQQLREYPPPWSIRTLPGVHGMTMLDIVDADGKTVQTTVDHPAVRPRVALIAEAVNAYATQQQAVRRQRDNDVALVRRFADTGKLSKAQREAVLAAADALACDEFDAALKEAPDGT